MKISQILFPPPFSARHYKRTYVASPDDELSQPSRTIMEVALSAVRRTLDVDVSDICKRMAPVQWNPELWPGEHYRLLAGLVAHLQPRTIVEIGTDTGLSALCLLKYLQPGGRLVTFDLIPWKHIRNTCLVADDFSDGRLTQELADLSDPAVFEKYIPLISKADLIFADGPKDGRFEPALAEYLDTIKFDRPPYILFDDIRHHNMLRFWRELRKPKLDISSFGHWTGTGLVHWCETPPDGGDHVVEKR